MTAPNPQHIVFKPDPFEQFQDWFDLARKQEVNDPEAMSLATISPDGTPNVRIVLCKSFGHEGFKFFTNMESTKGQELANNPNAALCFYWKSMQRQVRIKGIVSKLSDTENDSYFRQRHRESQIGAWASEQSRPLENMVHLVQKVYKFQEKFEGGSVPRPPYWGGYILKAQTMEFWVQRFFRLHERMLYTLDNNGWQQQRLYP